MKRARGFTVVELITVMVILGVISALAIPRLMGDSTFAAAAFRSEVASALRYAQKSAVSHRRLVCATVAARAVTLRVDTSNDDAPACGAALAGPIDSAYATTDAGVKTSSMLPGILYFQPAGTITSDAAGLSLVSGTITIISDGSQHSTVQVEGATGYVN